MPALAHNQTKTCSQTKNTVIAMYTCGPMSVKTNGEMTTDSAAQVKMDMQLYLFTLTVL